MQRRFTCFFATLALVVLLASCAAPPPPPSQDPEAPQATQKSGRVFRDSEGWTQFIPAADSRIVYVSDSEGDDATGKYYRPSDPALGNDPRNPGNNIQPFKTFSAAFKQTREGRPDWILLKRGDTFHESLAVRNGRSEQEPFLLASYGAASQVPLVKTGSERGLKICCKTFSDIAIQGIEFYAHTRNFDSPEFVSTEGNSGLSVYVKEGHYGSNLLVEGCKFRFFTGNAIQADGRLANTTLRRNLILDNYSTTGHSQGLFAKRSSLLLEENIFDHNGWYKQQKSGKLDNKKDGQATMFNHNTYFENTHDVIFRNNIFLRPSSIGTKWTANFGKASTRDITLENNLYIDGEIGISMGGNKSDPLRFKNISIRDNVMVNIGRSRPTDRDYAWYLEIRDWDQGEVVGNLLVHPGSKTTNNIFAIKMTGESRSVDIVDNQILGFGNGYVLALDEKARLQQVDVRDNVFHFQKDGRYFVRAKTPLGGIRFANNHYRSESESESEKLFSVAGKSLSLHDWQTASGDTGSQFQSRDSIADTSRVIERYQASLGQADSYQQFIEHLREQSHTNWMPEYTAGVINNWIREQSAGSPAQTMAGP